jgi:hypothetical protein
VRPRATAPPVACAEKKTRSAKQEDIHGSPLIDKVMNKRILKFDGFEIWDT